MPKAFKSITTDRLIIRPLILSDAMAYHEAEISSYFDMAHYWSWVSQHKPLSEIEIFIKEAERYHQQENPSAMYFAVISRETGVFQGCVWYAGINWFVPKFEIAYWQDSRKGGLGYMSEAVNALSQLTFTLYDAKRIEIKIFVNNPKSRRLAERLGFRQEVVLENYFIDFLTQDIVNGVTYVCCDVKQLPKLNSSIRA